MKILIGIEFNGNRYYGWQSQAGGNTIQDILQTAIGTVAGKPTVAFSAGRTDSGVHATLMPVHFNTTVTRQMSEWTKAISYYLPTDIRVLWAKLVDEKFHARHSCIHRYYQYTLYNRPCASALLGKNVAHCHVALDDKAMQLAANGLIGTHDFNAFRASSCQSESTIRQIVKFNIEKHQDYIYFQVCGNGFLHHMVRNMVGSLIDVGRARQAPEWITYLLQQKNRKLASPTAKPSGLYFCGADYGNAIARTLTIKPVPYGFADHSFFV